MLGQPPCHVRKAHCVPGNGDENEERRDSLDLVIKNAG